MPLCLDDSAPDSWGRTVVNASVGAVGAELDPLVYLLESGSDRVGAVDFQKSANEYVPRSPMTAPLAQLVHASETSGPRTGRSSWRTGRRRASSSYASCMAASPKSRQPRGPRREEQFAFEVMRRTLGIPIVHWDDGSQDAMVDGHFELADGRRGAVEVTTAAVQAAMQAEAEVSKWALQIPGLRWAWHINVGTDVRRAEFEQHLRLLLPRCEQQGVLNVDAVNPLPDLLDSLRWYFDHDIEAGASATTSYPGRIYIVPGTGSGGGIPDNLDGFSAWLGEQLATERFASDLAKLNNSGRAERHLWLCIHETWLSFGYDMHVAWEATLPTEPFIPPTGLTGVWLATSLKNPILYWTADRGWARTDAFD
jgi:hypothetical protein